MPEIVEKAESFATRKVGPLPVIAWVGIGVGGFVVFRLLTGGSSSGNAASPGTGALPAFDGSGTDAGGGGGTTTTPPAPVPNPLPVPGSTPSAVTLKFLQPTKIFTTAGTSLGYGHSGETYSASKIHLLGQDFYRFLRNNAAGKPQWTIVHVNANTIRVS